MLFQRTGIVAIMLGAVIFAGACVGTGTVTVSSIQRDIEAFRSDIARDRNAILSIKTRRVARNGFYYILNGEGKIVFHPRPLLVGADFSRYFFVSEILKKREGCFYYSMGEVSQLMIFRPLNGDEILCLSIPAEEVGGSNLSCENLVQKQSKE